MMKKTVWIILLSNLILNLSYSQSISYRNLYDDKLMPSIYLTLPADSLKLILDNPSQDILRRATFIFDDGTRRDTMLNVGMRLRGNTSRNAKKKSYKVKFNAYTSGRKYQGVKELNLNSNYNDPTLVREKLYYDIWNQFGLPNRRVSFAKLYVNSAYFGLYTNIEEMDDEWAKRVFGVDTGNLYKCTYPADLKYLGDNQTSYKTIMNNPLERAYDLKTNQTRDDYSDLVRLCRTYNQATTANLAAQLPTVFDVDGFLKAYAVEIMLGHWDDYAYNKNNYFLYNNPRSGVFQYISYDTDNTQGIDWAGKDWAVRNINAWHTAANAPLLDKILQVPFYKNLLNKHVKSLIDNVLVNYETRVDELKILVTPAAAADNYRILDYNFTMANFLDNFETTAIKQAKYGLKSFMRLRITNARNQLVLNSTPSVLNERSIKIYPNPTQRFFTIEPLNADFDSTWQANLLDVNGRLVQSKTSSEAALRFDTEGVATGVYFVQIVGEKLVSVNKIVINK